MSCGDLFLALIAILFPPIAVWIKSGLCTADSLINIALCCLGYVPGLIHAWYIIAKHPEHDYDYEPITDSERGGRDERVTYYYVNRPAPQSGARAGGYGTPAGSKPVPPVPQQRPQNAIAAGPSTGAGEGEGAPPSYSEVVRGDNKVQSQD
jgi:uncharacterized membrane protein YqaE (UPF0057 family)